MDRLISLLIPIYNSLPTLQACLNDVASQTDTNFEVILVDDGSTDGSSSLLAEMASRDRRFHLVTFKQNQGIVAAMNEGLKHCRGFYIARMDADDRMAPHRLASQRTFMENHPEVDLSGCQARFIRSDAAPTPAQLRLQDWSNNLLTDQAIKNQIFVESPIFHPTFFARSSFYQRMQGYQNNPWAEDYDFLLRAWLAGASFAKQDEVLVDKQDLPTRLYRTDPRCNRSAMNQAKIHYFAKSAYAQRSLVIAGTGSTGKSIADGLMAQDLNLHAFLDNRAGPPNRTVRGLPAHRWDQHLPPGLLGDQLVLLCIGNPEARADLESRLGQLGLKEGLNYLRFI